MSYSVYLVKNCTGFFLDFEHPTCKGKSNKQRVRPYFCPYRAKGFILWYPGRCPGLRTGCPFRALAAQFVIISPTRPRNSLIRLIRCYAVRGQTYFVVITRPNIFRRIPSPSKVLALNPSAPSEDGYFYADIFPGPALEEERQFVVVSAVEKFLGRIAVVR